MRTTRMMRIVVFLILTMALCSRVVWAQAGGIPGGIPEDQRPSAVIIWLVGIGLGAVTVLAAFKNAKRSHLD